MYHFSYSPICSPEEHLSNLENLYAECLKDNMDRATLADIYMHIKKLRRQIKENKKREWEANARDLQFIRKEPDIDQLKPIVK